jgi:5-methylcytosine-specific restriction endonuclease McrA
MDKADRWIQRELTKRQKKQTKKSWRDALDRFWKDFDNLTFEGERICLLKWYAEYRIENSSSYYERKAAFKKQKGKHMRIFGSCLVCPEPAQHRHHIIQLQNGGPNDKQNLILLCEGCHRTIHPWLAPSDTMVAMEEAREREREQWWERKTKVPY